MLQVIAGPSPGAPLGSGIRGRDFVAAASTRMPPGVRVAYCPDIAAIGVDGSIEATCRAAAFALADHGADVREIACDLSGWRDTFLTLRAEWFLAGMAGRMDCRDDFGVNVRANVEAGLALDPRALGAAHHARGQFVAHDARALLAGGLSGDADHGGAALPGRAEPSTEVAGRPMPTYRLDWFAPHLPAEPHRPADRVGALRPRCARSARGSADCRPTAG